MQMVEDTPVAVAYRVQGVPRTYLPVRFYAYSARSALLLVTGDRLSRRTKMGMNFLRPYRDIDICLHLVK